MVDRVSDRLQPVRFLLVGASNFLVAFAVFHLLLLAMPPLPVRAALSQLVAYALGVAWSYHWNRRFTFRSRDPAGPQAARFVAFQVAIALVSAAAVGLLVDGMGLPPTPAWLGVVASVTVVNYLGSRFWVFRRRGPVPADTGAGRRR
ncbi:MAG: GtrA family protein [Candidatus Krumholzibacteriia bacterium]